MNINKMYRQSITGNDGAANSEVVLDNIASNLPEIKLSPKALSSAIRSIRSKKGSSQLHKEN